MGNFRHFSSVEILLDLASVMTHGIVHVDDQLFPVDSPLGVRIFLGKFWCNNSQEMVLIEFLFARKNTEDQKFRLGEEYGHMKDRRL
jgi:hypothetical protein